MTIFGPAVSAPGDAAAASWIKSRLGEFGKVGGLVPDGFDQYLLVRPVRIANGGVDDHAQIATIASVARRHTTTPEVVWFAIWEGHGWASSTTLYSVSRHGRSTGLGRAPARLRARVVDRRRHRRIVRALEQVPRFDLPNRRYHLVHGPLQAAVSISEPGASRLQIPDMWWPDDRSWFVATDTDLAWTYIGGGQDFITEMIEALPERTTIVQRDDDNQFM